MTNPQERLWLGIDGGGTKTLAVVIDDAGLEISRAEAGPSNRRAVGDEAAAKALTDVVTRAIQPLLVEGKRVSGWCVGIAGSVLPRDGPWLWQVCESLLPNTPVFFTHDAEIALIGATGRRLGVVVIAGTGSIAFGVNPAGQTARAGGWGYLLGDEGSGYAIGMAGIRAALRQHDGRGPHTVLTSRLQHQLHLPVWDTIIGEVYGGRIGVTEIASLARIVLNVALEGDTVAIEIITAAGRDLGSTAVAVLSRLAWPSSHPCDVALSGSLLQGNTPLIQELRNTVLARYPQAHFLTPRRSAAVGAALLAREKFA